MLTALDDMLMQQCAELFVKELNQRDIKLLEKALTRLPV